MQKIIVKSKSPQKAGSLPKKKRCNCSTHKPHQIGKKRCHECEKRK